ncbi:MAG: M48 family metallopeptidase [Marinilabiliaceae bacterium]
MTYTMDIEPFGRIEVSETARSRRIAVKIYPGGVLKVSAPLKTEPKSIHTFIKLNQSSIVEAIERAKEKTSAQPGDIVFAPGTRFKTRQRELTFRPQTEGEKDLKARITYDKVTILYPKDTKFESDFFQKFTRKAIDAALKNEAMNYLPKRTAELAAKHGFKYDRVALRNMTSQWGSCSTEGRICLNIQLMRLPDELIDLVILHELTHTVHFDHSKAFYAVLNEHLGGRHDELAAKLRNYRTIY